MNNIHFWFIFNYLLWLWLCINFPISTAQQTSTFSQLKCNESHTSPSPRFRYYLATMITQVQFKSNSVHFYYDSDSKHEVYVSYLCRGDINITRCNGCVVEASKTAAQKCNMTSKQAFIWMDECMFRYSDQSFWAQMQETPNFTVPSESDTPNATAPTAFNNTKLDQVLKQVTDDLVAKLELGDPYGRKYTTAVANISESADKGKMYAAGECTYDLYLKDCTSCLRDCIKMLPLPRERMGLGGRVLFPSCSVRYETYQFYQLGAVDDYYLPIFGPIRTNPRALLPPPPPFPDVSPSSMGNPGINRSRGRKFPPPRPPHVPEMDLLVGTGAALLVAMMLSIFCVLYYAHKRKTRPRLDDMEEITSVDSLQIDFHKIRVATHNFAADTKLGQGGFGEVYKGKLENGQFVAVKRLSRDSGQGTGEFKTEILLVANLQHRNLVKLLGFCLSGKEKILVYEFLANSSLDKILFDPMKRETLSWETRFKIISGIAKGLLYLHEDSRLKIIHRDLKTSNILLDDFMNPKISDFGMAKLFGVDQTQDATKTIVGTYGYMAPEYMITGQYSVKSDVYSFGIIILELVTGLRNSYMSRPLLEEALLHRAWRLWSEDSELELVDYVLGDTYSREEVKKCIHIGLLCIQENAARRPQMTWIVAAIRDETSSFPEPTPPNFFNSIRSSRSDTGASSDPGASSSTKREALTDLHGR